jgi:hypothetical protein
MVNSTTAIVAYTGARPGGRAAPDLSTVPVLADPNLTFFFTLAFANDADGTGNFQPQWDPNITPDVIAQLKQGNGSIQFKASLGGDANDAPWPAPSDQSGWVNNATDSLLKLMDSYGLDGLDIDYEGGSGGAPLDDSFVQCMSQVINNIGSQTNQASIIAPFGQTAAAYQALYEQSSTWIALINYQAYADDIQDVQGYLTLYDNLTRQFNVDYETLGLGIASSNGQADDMRGLQPPDIYTVWDSLHGQGTICAAIWDLEDSQLCDPPFAIENAIQMRS